MFFKFAKTAGDALQTSAGSVAVGIKERILGYRTKIDGLEVQEQYDRVILNGTAKTQEEAEKAIISAGNTLGIAEVESQLEIEEPALPAIFYTVVSGDSLSKIAQEFYGDPTKYLAIFDANKPMLSDPDKIYPGQTLRIPTLN